MQKLNLNEINFRTLKCTREWKYCILNKKKEEEHKRLFVC